MSYIFYNHFHNGDIHVSRSFIRKILPFLNGDKYFAHRNDSCLLNDIENLKYDSACLNMIDIHHLILQKDDSKYINTWYAANSYKYFNKHGITFDCLYALYDDVCKELLNCSLSEICEDPYELFPEIYYSKFYIENINKWIANDRKKIFISNGNSLSGQSHNFPITGAIIRLAKRHKEIDWILANKEENCENLHLENLFYSKDIIKKQTGSDLNENAYLSTFCDIIIGRASGAFTYCFNKDNLFNRDCKMLVFSNLTNKKFWLGSNFESIVDYKAKIINSDYNFETADLINKIEEVLNG